MSEYEPDLSLLGTRELAEEIARRHVACVFVALKDDPRGTEAGSEARGFTMARIPSENRDDYLGEILQVSKVSLAFAYQHGETRGGKGGAA